MNRVVEALKDKQGGMTNAEFAKLLGISDAMWGYLLKGERQPGGKLLKAAMRKFPDLTLVVMNYLAEEDTDGNGN